LQIEDALKKTLFESAQAACSVLVHHYGNIEQVKHKGEIDLVTRADRESEEAVLRCIRKAFPDHAILAEESGETEGDDSEYRWVIDPLDGTTNYAHGNPIFSVSLAVQHQGETIMGLVVAPVANEWFFAHRGHGGLLNGKPLRVSKRPTLAESLLLTGFPHDRRKDIDHFMRILGSLLMRSHGVLRLGSAALDLCYVAAGRGEAFWEEHLSPWDVAAGNLIVEEAGGRCTDFDGHRSTIFDRAFIASNGAIHDELRQAIVEHWQPW
jgi:myo-inositol-1(or 4)-monophosphatase